MRILITGFEPFGGQDINPSWEAVRQLPDSLEGHLLRKLQVPVVFGAAAEKVAAEKDSFRPDIILCTGQAGGRSGMTPERVAINLRDASIPDNAGFQPQDEPVLEGGPAALFSTVPVKKMSEAIRSAGVPSAVSLSAGSFVCNDLFYSLLSCCSDSSTRVGFLHVPYLPEQAAGNEPSLPADSLYSGLLAAVRSLLEE